MALPNRFQPSAQSSYGFVSAYPLSALTVSGTATSRGLSNQPSTDAHRRNLSKLSDFLGRLPMPVRVTSAYRSPEVNAAVSGASSSQHMNGLAADLTPGGMSNVQMATWLYLNRAKLPELDQVIWYKDTSHVHIGICPSGATGCQRRGSFMMGVKEGADYTAWAPTTQELEDVKVRFRHYRLKSGQKWMLYAGVSVGSALVLLSVMAIAGRRR